MKIHAVFQRLFGPGPASLRRKAPWEYFSTIKFEEKGTYGVPSRWLQIWPAVDGVDERGDARQWIPLRKIEMIELEPVNSTQKCSDDLYSIVVTTANFRFRCCEESLNFNVAKKCVETLAAMISRS